MSNVSFILNGLLIDLESKINIKGIFESIQGLRIYNYNDYYILILKQKIIKLYTKDNKLFLENITLSELPYYMEYLNLNHNQVYSKSVINKYPELLDYIDIDKDIRIINYNIEEIIIYSCALYKSNIEDARYKVDTLSIMAGNNVDNYYTFPKLQSLKDLTEDDWKLCGFLNTSKYVKELLNNCIGIQNYSSSELKTKLPNIPDDILQFICLFGCKDEHAFILNKKIKKILFTVYGMSEHKSIEQLHEFIRTRFGSDSSIVCRYLL